MAEHLSEQPSPNGAGVCIPRGAPYPGSRGASNSRTAEGDSRWQTAQDPNLLLQTPHEPASAASAFICGAALQRFVVG